MRITVLISRIRCLILGAVFLLLYVGIVHCQNTDFNDFKQRKQQEWATYKDAKQKELADYRKQLNKEYADRMSMQWTSRHVSAAVPVPSRPEPPKPVVKTNSVPTPTCSLSVKDFVSTGTYEMPQPVQPIAHPYNEAAASYMFSFHSTPCKIHLHRDMGFTLSDISEKTVAEAWKTMSQSGFDVTAYDCLGYREQLDLNDWGYVELTKTLSQHFCGEESNEAVLMQAYLLAQSGYKVRLARTDIKLVLLIPFTNEIYGYSYFSFDNEKYYLLDEKKEGGSYYIFNEKFEGEQTASLTLRKEPRFFDEHASTRTYPYSDCEDRSILFSILVRDLLDLDVVMLNYPGHLATAVKFSEEVPGYYFMVKGEKYVVCDPTYIGASAGDCMPQFVGTCAVIVEIGD